MSVVGAQDRQTHPARSYLYVPASDPAMIDKALRSRADAVVLDLEDAVPADRKAAARANAAAVLDGAPPIPVYIRVNAFDSGLVEDDLAALAGPHLTGVRLPKAEDPAAIRAVRRRLADAGCPAVIVPLVESALGVERAFELVTADDAVATLAMGEADLRADLRVGSDGALDYARSRCVLAARAAHRAPAIQSVHTQVRDLQALRTTTEHGRAMGFGGRSAIHPAQVPVINDVFTPSEAERARAAAVVTAHEEARRRGKAVATTADGQFVDAAVLLDARAVLALAALPRS